MDPLKMYFLLNMGIFHCYVSLPEGILLTKSIMWNFQQLQVMIWYGRKASKRYVNIIVNVGALICDRWELGGWLFQSPVSPTYHCSVNSPSERERERFPASSFSFKPWEIHISIWEFVISVGFHIYFWLNEIKIIWPDNCHPDVCLYIVYPKIQEDLRVNPTTCPCRSRQITIFWMNLIQPGSRAPQNPSWIVEVEPLHQFANWFFKSLRIERFFVKTRSATNDSSKLFFVWNFGRNALPIWQFGLQIAIAFNQTWKCDTWERSWGVIPCCAFPG